MAITYQDRRLGPAENIKDSYDKINQNSGEAKIDLKSLQGQIDSISTADSNASIGVYTITDVTNTNDYVGNITGLTLFDDLRLDLEVTSPNTGSATLDIGDGSGSKSIKFINSQGDKVDLPAGELFGANKLKYDGVDWVLLQKDFKNSRYNVKDFGATGFGLINDTLALQNTIDLCVSKGGGVVFIPNGTYLIDSVTIPFTGFNDDNVARVLLKGEGKSTKLIANSENVSIVKLSGSHNKIKDLQINGNNLSGTIGLGLIPEDENQTTEYVGQDYNVMENLFITKCDCGLVFKTGPVVGGLDSQCFYNMFNNSYIYNCNVGIWLANGTTTGSAPCNRNMFNNLRLSTGMNTGILIDHADTCQFVNVNLEGISSGVSPTATPTAVIVRESGLRSDNNHNRFVNLTVESATRDILVENDRTFFFGVVGKVEGSSVPNLRACFPSDIVDTPVVIPGLVYPEGTGFAPFKNGGWNLTEPIYLNEINFADYNQGTLTSYEWKNYTIDLTNTTNITSISQMESKFKKVDGFIEWHFRFQFEAVVAGDDVEIEVPYTPETQLYLQQGANKPMHFNVIISEGGNPETAIGVFSNSTVTPTVLKVTPNNVWNTTGEFNFIQGTIRYKG